MSVTKIAKPGLEEEQEWEWQLSNAPDITWIHFLQINNLQNSVGNWPLV